ncbi:MAG: STAS domain-containing protein [Gammaproteobacteria bacterium]|jgi:anti-anti-sigma factor
MNNGKVYHASHDGVHVLRFTGDIRYTLSPSLEAFIEQLFAGDRPRGFVLDLCGAESIDSTNLGLMAGIADQMRGTEDSRVTILSDRADINELLASMGFDEVFDIVSSRTAAAVEDRAIPLETPRAEALSRTVLKAHRTLMALNETNRELFRDVVALMEQNESGGEDDAGH